MWLRDRVYDFSILAADLDELTPCLTQSPADSQITSGANGDGLCNRRAFRTTATVREATGLETANATESEVAELIESGLAQLDWWEIDIDEMLQTLDAMSDSDLWQAAESRLSVKQSRRLESLHAKRQREGLTKVEREEARRLTEQYERGLLIRARAAALLQGRGHDVARLLTK